MKRLHDLSLAVLHDSGMELDAESVRRDSIRLIERTEKEGESFLTITLPTFCQAFERALARGHVIKEDWPGWAKNSRGLPLFLAGFLNRVFGVDGRLLGDACVSSIRSVRQITLLHKKVWATASAVRQKAAIDAYVACERELEHVESDSIFRQVAGILVSRLFANDKQGYSPDRIVGAHGPGATQDRQKGNSKWRFSTWSHRLESVFPHAFHCWNTEESAYSSSILSWPLGLDDVDLPLADDIKFLSEDEEPPVRVVFVPKTMKSPRVIAIEPSWNQYIQQGLLRYLVPLIERCDLTSGRVNFSDQTVNQRLALSSSATGRFATIDMKEASDRVTLQHVNDLFAVEPAFLASLMASRTRAAELPDGRVVPLRKFASMGSAVCFPVEALAFFVGVIAGRFAARGTSVTPERVAKLAKDVYVFGDDIILPTDEASAIVEYLESIGFRCNSHKSFWTGKFRESCGMDAYDGQDITPVYCRRPLDRADPSSVVGWVAMANQFYHKGMWQTARMVRACVERELGQTLPHVRLTSAALGWHSLSNLASHSRWNRTLHRFETRGLVPTALRQKDPLDGLYALHKCLKSLTNRRSDASDVDDKHLLESVRPWSLQLKTRWVPT